MAINYELLNSGAMTVGGGFNLYSKNPLDSRLVIPGFDGLQTLIDNGAAYEGMIVYISSEKKHYEVKTIDGVLSYKQFGLTNDELNELITNATTAAMEFKGVAATLPENPAKGDMYKVSGETIDITIDGVAAKAGDSIVYNGEQWFLIPSGDDIEDTWRPVTDVDNDATLTFKAGEKLDVAVAATGDITYSHKTVAAPTNTNAEGDTKVREYITSLETDGYGHITGYKTNTEVVEDTNTTYDFECAAEHSNVYFTVKEKLNGEEVAEHTVCVDAYNKNEVDTELAKKLDANGWVGNYQKDGWEYYTTEGSACSASINSQKVYLADAGNGFYSTSITAGKLSTYDIGDCREVELKYDGTIRHALQDPADKNPDSDYVFDATINLPTRSGTLALTSDVDTAQAAAAKDAADKAAVVLAEAQKYADAEISDFNTETVTPLAERVKAIEDAPYATEAQVNAKLDGNGWESIDGVLSFTKSESSAQPEIEINPNASRISVSSSDGNNYVAIDASNGVQIQGAYITDIKSGGISVMDTSTLEKTDVRFPMQSGTFALTSDVDTALQAAKDYADAKSHENTTYEFAATENPLEFTVTPSEGEAKTITLVAPTVDTGVMKVTAGTDIVVTPEAGTGEVTVAHKGYQTGTIKAAEGTEEPNFVTSVTINNGHVEGATVQTLRAALESMTFIFDGGTSAE